MVVWFPCALYTTALPGLHHWAGHASYGFFDSPFKTALVVSIDGGGDDGSLNVFFGNRTNSEVCVPLCT